MPLNEMLFIYQQMSYLGRGFSEFVRMGGFVRLFNSVERGGIQQHGYRRSSISAIRAVVEPGENKNYGAFWVSHRKRLRKMLPPDW
jgi:hypothetical protein